VRELNVTPHVTKKRQRPHQQPGSANHAASRLRVSLSRRWLVEKGFGWLKQTGPLRQVKLRGLEKVDWLFVFSCAAHNCTAAATDGSTAGKAPGAVCMSGVEDIGMVFGGPQTR